MTTFELWLPCGKNKAELFALMNVLLEQTPEWRLGHPNGKCLQFFEKNCCSHRNSLEQYILAKIKFTCPSRNWQTSFTRSLASQSTQSSWWHGLRGYWHHAFLWRRSGCCRSLPVLMQLLESTPSPLKWRNGNTWYSTDDRFQNTLLWSQYFLSFWEMRMFAFLQSTIVAIACV